MEKALGDLRVLEVAHAWAGPLTGMYLADMGAEVIKIEKPGVGDLQRSPMAHGPSAEGELGNELEKFLKDKTNSEALKILDEAGIACAPVLSIDEVINDPQFKEREMFVDVDHPKLGKMKMMGVVPKLSETPGSVESAGPLLGQHNEEVYSGLMGYSKEEITRLREEKII